MITNSVVFLNFIKELIDKTKINKNINFILIMDKLSCHRKDDVIQLLFLFDSKIKVIKVL